MKKNPFTLMFGQKPLQFISRLSQTDAILGDFLEEPVSSHIYILTGVRGSGKTVMMTTISQKIAENSDWIVIELNPTRDLLQGLAARLYDHSDLQHIFFNAKLNLSAFGIGVTIDGAPPVADIETALKKMLEQIQKAGKKVLITIDEVVNNENVRIFTSAFQIFVRQNLPIFLLMTGLYDNIYDLQNEETQTFLYRAPKIILDPLNYTAVRSQYQKVFDISTEEAEKMAALVKGYPFAFQVLGSLYWNHRTEPSEDLISDILPEYDQYLSEYVYEKIWSEMSEQDRKIVAVLADHGEIKIKDLREKLEGMSSEKFSVYRDRLKRKGVISTENYGKVSLILPRFSEFVKDRLY